MTLDKFIQEQVLQHKRPNTVKNHKISLSLLDKFKPLDECTSDDLKQFIERYIKDFETRHGRKPQEGNLNFMYTSFKKYYKWANKPEVVAWIKTKKVLKKINLNKLLTPAEVQRMLRVCTKDRDKCMIAIAYESGMRLGELLSLRLDDLKLLDNECNVRIPENYEDEYINAKTRSRSLILIESVPYIEKYLMVHDGGEKLFDLKKTRSHEIIKGLARKAGINKNVYWHLLRHTRATEMARFGMQETAMKKRFGWQEDSSMIKRYTSLTDDDADNAYREALGLGVKKKDITINPIAKKCSKCNKLIDTGEYCPQCAEIQRLSEANMKASLEKEQLKERAENQDRIIETMRKDMEKIQKFIEMGGLELLKNNKD